MQKTPDFYDFCGVRLFVADLHIEILESGKEYIPSPIHRSFLIALIRKSPEVVTYEELWKEVWRSQREMSETDLRNIQTTKGQLALWFKDKINRNLPIEAEPGKGYRLNCEVTPGWYESENSSEIINQSEENESEEFFDESKPVSQTQSEKIEDENVEHEITSWQQLFYSHSKYIFIVGFFYGLLYFIAAILEIAYQFDVYGIKAIIFGGMFLIINFAAVPASLALIIYRLYNQKPGLTLAIVVLVCAGILTILLSALYLPMTPVTEAQLQTQPAFVAFGKNVLIYFLPLGIVFMLLPFYAAFAKRLKEIKLMEKLPKDIIFIKPWQLLLIYLGAVVFSLLTTNHLLDRLESESEYHALFAGLLLLRFVTYFGLGLGLLIWCYIQINKEENAKD